MLRAMLQLGELVGCPCEKEKADLCFGGAFCGHDVGDVGDDEEEAMEDGDGSGRKGGCVT